jgi:hypothetical protein
MTIAGRLPSNREPSKPAKFHTSLTFHSCLALYSLMGFLGALWISDEWDALRMQAIAFGGLPIAAIYILLHFQWPKWHTKYPTINVLFIVAQLAIFGGGHLATINAVTGSQKPIKVFMQNQTATSMEWNRHRGGLGILYKPRW